MQLSHLSSWYCATFVYGQSITKSSLAGCTNARHLGGFQTPPASAVAGRNAGQVDAPMLSMGSLLFGHSIPLPFHCSWMLEKHRKCFLLHWESRVVSHPGNIQALSSMESCRILNLLLSHEMLFPRTRRHVVCGQSWYEMQVPAATRQDVVVSCPVSVTKVQGRVLGREK